MKKLRFDFGYILTLLISLTVALLIGAGILAITGHNPLAAYRALLGGAFSNARHIGDMLEYAMVLCLCGLACDIGSRVGIFNVGGEGQLLLGAIFAAQIGVWLKALSPWLAIPCAALGAMAVGGFYAWIPGVLKVKLKVNEVITTIMLNTVAVFLCQFLAKGPWKNANKNIVAGTENLPSSFWLKKLVPGSNLSSAIIAAAVITFLVIDRKRIRARRQRRREARAQWREREKLRNSYVLNLSPYEYEEYVAEELRREGFTDVDTTPKSGDFGADVLAMDGEWRVCVQCKRYAPGHPVGVKAVQEVYSAKDYYGCDEAYIYTTSDYTKAAVDMAAELGVILVRTEI